MASNVYFLRVWYPAFTNDPVAGRAVRTAAGRQRNLMMRRIARIVRQAAPRRTGALRRAIRYRSIQNRFGLAVSRLSTRKFYSSFVDDRTKWFTDATVEGDIIVEIQPLIGEWERALEIALERAAQRILSRAAKDQIKVRFSR